MRSRRDFHWENGEDKLSVFSRARVEVEAVQAEGHRTLLVFLIEKLLKLLA